VRRLLRRGAKCLTARRNLHGALFSDVPLAIFGDVAFIVFPFTFCKRDLALHQMSFPIDLRAHARVPFLLCGLKDTRKFFAVEQQFACSGRVGNEVRARANKWRNKSAKQPSFPIFDQDVAIHELHLLLAQTFHFPTSQRDTGFEPVLDEVVVICLFVHDDSAVVVFHFLCFSHA